MNRFGCGGTHLADVGLPLASLFNEAKAPPMRPLIDIDYVHSWAIVREIGERLRTSLKPEPERPASFQNASAPHWRSSHRQSFQCRALTPLNRRWDGRTGRAMPPVKRPALKVLNAYGKVQFELIGKAV